MMVDQDFIHRFEPGAQGESRTLLLLHGTGGNEHDLIDLGRTVAPGWALLSPRGKVLENGVPRFFRRLAEGVFDEADLKFRATELADFLGQAAARYGIDPHKMIALGYSNGANIASALMLMRPDTIGAAALLRPMVPFAPDAIPDLTGKRVLLAPGRHDPIAPPSHAQSLASTFQRGGATVDIALAEASHGLTQADVHAVAEWLAKPD